MNSSRAGILERVLAFINSGDWEDKGDFLIFGKDAFELSIEIGGNKNSLDESLKTFITKRKINAGELLLSSRISVGRPPKDTLAADVADLESQLTLEQKALLIDAMQASMRVQPNSQNAHSWTDDLDAALASDAIERLGEAFERVVAFNEVSLGSALARNAEYFKEAHLCDINGLKIASAVLCRATLESALKHEIDPNGTIYREKHRSYIDAMIDEAERGGRLGDNRPEEAREIKQAGNDAIHEPKEFRRKYEKRMREIVDNTRKVIEDLYL